MLTEFIRPKDGIFFDVFFSPEGRIFFLVIFKTKQKTLIELDQQTLFAQRASQKWSGSVKRNQEINNLDSFEAINSRQAVVYRCRSGDPGRCIPALGQNPKTFCLSIFFNVIPVSFLGCCIFPSKLIYIYIKIFDRKKKSLFFRENLWSDILEVASRLGALKWPKQQMSSKSMVLGPKFEVVLIEMSSKT